MFIGANQSISKSFSKAVLNSTSIGGNALQVFLRTPMRNTPIKIKDDEFSKVLSLLQENNSKCVVHSSYLYNFSKTTDEIDWCISNMKQELEYCDKFNGIGCIIHMGKYLKLSKDNAFQNYIDNINLILNELNTQSKLILENSASQGTEIGNKIDDLARIYDGIIEKEKVGFCLDTCHLFASGYNLSEPEIAIETINEFDEKIGLDKLLVVHLNDSKKDCGCRVDRHENLECGKIAIEGLKTFVETLREKNYEGLIILETPKDDNETRQYEISMIKSWIYN